MSKTSIISMIIFLVLIGILLLGVLIYGLSNKDFSLLKEEVIFEQSYEVKDFKLDSKTVNVHFKKSDNELIKIEIYGSKDDTFEVSDVEELSLTYRIHNKVGIDFNKREINVYLPSNYDRNITINSTTGNIESEVDLVNIKIDGTTGNVKLGNVLNKLELKLTTGNIRINELNINEESNIKSTTGSIKVEKANIKANTNIKLTTGNVKIKNINKDIYINTKVTTGNAKTIDGDRFSKVELYVEATTGNIKIGKE